MEHMGNESAKVASLSEEITKMVEEDQKMRSASQNEGKPFDSLVDHKNTSRMREIIKEIGWPTISKVGKEVSRNAWLLVQHADDDVDFQIKCLDLMKDQPDGEVSRHDIAYLEDRVRVNTNRLQLYGTQFYLDEKGEFGPKPIEDAGNVEARRKEIGLEPFSDYYERMMKFYRPRQYLKPDGN